MININMRSDIMKEIIVVNPHEVEVREVEIPKISNEYEVLVKMK